MHWYLLSADSRPFLRHLTLPPLSPDTYESLVLAYLGIFLFDTDHLDIADRSAIDIWPSLPCLQTRTSLTCISIPRNLFFLMQILFFFWCVYHVEILDSSIEVQGNIFLMQINFYFDTYGDIFFWCVFIFFLILHPWKWSQGRRYRTSLLAAGFLWQKKFECHSHSCRAIIDHLDLCHPRHLTTFWEMLFEFKIAVKVFSSVLRY